MKRRNHDVCDNYNEAMKEEIQARIDNYKKKQAALKEDE